MKIQKGRRSAYLLWECLKGCSSKTSEDGIEVGETQVVNRVHENTEQYRQLEKDVLRQDQEKVQKCSYQISHSLCFLLS